ncbi:MAG: hypothetical protein HY216_04975 [Candidatus Rokubacteria bacterium]|nr:hypothetical protein [Candidatus Rokubacteria bacterium]
MGRATPELGADAVAALIAFDWPGNVRALQNEMLRLAATVRAPSIERSDLAEGIRGSGTAGAPTREPSSLPAAVEALERRMIEDALTRARHNQARAATLLGISRQGLIKKMKRYGIATRPDR